ncbi:MAG: amidohydrolase family protein [Actinophytocola sp.]|uniref:amidohydrolase family protein n=1 Tax=Actinophytocola sp. TaxID=1872138 RepID=UPI0013242A32|nr:amidohydrolase family protein [Actinophytocola sp.]MPZ84625.1 amidohydrolase family protein [Actinophytocola sp.]
MSEPVIDLHAHHVGADAVARIDAEGAAHGVTVVGKKIQVGARLTGLPVVAGLTDVDARLSWMDQAGVDVQLVAGWMDLAGYHLPPADGRWLARVQNEALAALVAAHPRRFAAAAAVPLQDPELAATELDRAVTELGHVAVQIGARVEHGGLDEPVLDPFWSAAEELGVPVVVHPAELDVPDRHRRLFLHILTGNPAETTNAAAALMLGGVLDRHPGLRFLLVHGGGFLPYQFGRIARGAVAAPEPVRSRSAHPPRDLLRHFHFDTVVHDPGALRYLEDFASGRVVLGSDYPFPMRDIDPVGSVGKAIDDREARDSILSRTPAGLLARRRTP